MCVAVIGLFSAFKFGSASLDYAGVKNTIDEWQENASVQSKQEYEDVQTTMLEINALHGANPFYIDVAGQVQEWGAVSGFANKEALQDAKANYLAATKLRPLWPVTWANLAMIKWRLQQFDDEMLGFLHKANDLGPYSTEVHLLFTRLGISLYQANHPMFVDIKDIVYKRIGLGLRNADSKPLVLAFIDSTGALKNVCQWVTVDSDFTADQHLSCE